ncbi:TetR/AcrR family transcriptional regulator [Paraburkholderia caballeronis]|uniref:TetR/AcrR family transcriptional regulator n=1 Tax=Paraburkholderia caballeronis TaxID=416943 RepID=UPI00106619A8|nr:TetR/AcrR family transcriptional regulator [Paraburkholderia caballeronis]TDV17137.1 TetR family transcriptional regulator [Paraburkholderia caballeronis]TDV17522.1 TetR family transcriptional regulator [Paraburkholderia caballeronis]TDV27540.1 TetR family transcriptional regulator [Paraburkholderia caballeronis]
MGIADRKNREKQALRERILGAARRIVMRDGFAALSMRKIADAIEYSPATLYLHFASRDEIARALCEEGYAQLLGSFAPLAQIADPRERLHALAHAYVGFGREHAQTYRLIFMENPSYTGAALGGAKKEGEADDDAGDAAFRLLTDALAALKTDGRIPADADPATWAEALWATLHGIVALSLTCPVFPHAPLETIVDTTFDAWFGAPSAPARARGGKPVDAGPAAPAASPATRAAARSRKPKAPSS